MAETPGIDLSKEVHVSHGAYNTTPKTGKHLRYDPIHITGVPVSDSKKLEMTWEYPIDIHAGFLYAVIDEADGTKAMEYGDGVCVYGDVGPIGDVDTAAAIDDTLISVDNSVANIIDIGDFVTFAADTNIYEVTDKDKAADTITIKPGLVVAASVGDDVNFRRYFIGTGAKPVQLGPNGTEYVWGRETFDSARLVPGKKLVIEYTNGSDTKVKAVVGAIALLY